MNVLTNAPIDWSNPKALNQIIKHIQMPLEKIMELNEGNLRNDKLSYEVIFSSSRQIKYVIEHILEEIQSKSISLTYKKEPEIFLIYESNQNVQKMCTGEIMPQKIIDADRQWLLNLEEEIFNSITRNDLNIYGLSLKLAVSERQLYRKTDELIHLTPNKYVRIIRLHKAKQMIENFVERSISQIAYAVGFNDTHYFSKQFSYQYNISPRELVLSL